MHIVRRSCIIFAIKDVLIERSCNRHDTRISSCFHEGIRSWDGSLTRLESDSSSNSMTILDGNITVSTLEMHESCNTQISDERNIGIEIDISDDRIWIDVYYLWSSSWDGEVRGRKRSRSKYITREIDSQYLHFSIIFYISIHRKSIIFSYKFFSRGDKKSS